MTSIPTREEIKIRYQSAPTYIREFITSPKLRKAFDEIRDTHKLHLSEAENVSKALNAVFLDMRPAADFPELLTVALEANRAAYDAILKDINTKIFIEFRSELQGAGRPAASSDSSTSPRVTSTEEGRGNPAILQAPSLPSLTPRPEPPPTQPQHSTQPQPPQPQSPQPPAKPDPYRESIE